MDPIDQRTGVYGLALPDPSNDLEVDVLRLRESLFSLDSVLVGLSQIIGSHHHGIGNIDGLIQALGDLQQLISDQIETRAPTVHTHSLASLGAAASGHSHSLASLGAAALNHTHAPEPTRGPSNLTLYRVGGALDSVSFEQDGIAGAVFLTRTEGRLTKVVTSYKGRTRTETLNYTDDVLTSVTATET